MVEGARRVTHQSLRYFHSPYCTIEGLEREVVSVFHVPHEYQVIQGHEVDQWWNLWADLIILDAQILIHSSQSTP